MYKLTVHDFGEIRFSLRDTKEEKTMIRARVTIKGRRMTYFLPSEHKVKPAWWDKQAGLAIVDSKRNPDTKGNQLLRNYLENVNAEIRRTHNTILEIIENMKARKIAYSADMVKDLIVAKLKPDSARPTVNIPRDLLGYTKWYIGLLEDGTILTNKGTRLTKGTIQAYYSTLAALKKYCDKHRVHPSIDTISMEFYYSFMKYLNAAIHARGERYTLNTQGKFMKCIIAMLRYGFDMGYSTNQVYSHRDFKVPAAMTEEVYLNDTELEALANLPLTGRRAETRDAFLIAAWTGVRHSDLMAMNDTHINLEERKITINSLKTGTKSVIPMNSKVIEILNRYHGKMPPVPSNPVMNRLIKSICKDAGFTQPVNIISIRGGQEIREVKEKWMLVTVHTARRSMATNLANKGISLMDLQSLTGHADIHTLKRYLRTTKEEIADKLINETDFFN